MSKTISTLLGLAIGDALGRPFEFSNQKQIKEWNWKGDFVSGELWKLKAGQWTDDTLMALCLTKSLLEKKDFDGNDVGAKYVTWLDSGDLRGIGSTCERSIANIKNGIAITESGRKEKSKAKPSFARVGAIFSKSSDFCGNGTVMRAAPIGLYFRNDLNKLEQAAKIDATMTHDHPDARDSSYALCVFIAKMANGSSKADALKDVLELKYEYPHIVDFLCMAVKNIPYDIQIAANELGTRGTAHETFASAVYCFMKFANYKDAVINSILIGGDTDSRAAIVGALAGTFYGLEGIPAEYVSGVEDSERLQKLDQQLVGHA